MQAILEAPTEAPAPALIEPGIYYDVPGEVYHSWPFASNSRCSKLLRSPAHLKEELDNPKEKTPALILGSAIHTAVLEPHLFGADYAVAPVWDKRTTAGKALFAAFEAENKGKTVLKAADAETCTAISASTRKHPSASLLLEADGHNEVSIIWDDPETGIRCKARIDKLSLEFGILVDLKSTENASKAAFTRSIFQYGYFRQAAFYIDGLRELGIEINDFVIVAVEKSAPYGVGTYRILDEAVEAGRAQIAPLLATWKECQESGIWPAYSDEIEDIGLPAWGWSQLNSGDTDIL